MTLCKTRANPGAPKVYFDSPLPYDLRAVTQCLSNLTRETKDAENPLHICTDTDDKTFQTEDEKLLWYCDASRAFSGKKQGKVNKGAYADGSIDKFVRRLASRIENSRLQFLFGAATACLSLEAVLQQFTGYTTTRESNVTIIDLSGVPFEVLSITVSVITRLLFDYSYYYRRITKGCDTPLLLVYEEAHKYAPRSELARYRASLSAIERVAKEGRKYGTSLLIASQRPSEISETIFSQCSSFLGMRLTNPDDQAYVRRLLPDSLGSLTESLPSLQAGEALLIGDSAVMPSVVYVGACNPVPSSADIPYLEKWKEQWRAVNFATLAAEWRK